MCCRHDASDDPVPPARIGTGDEGEVPLMRKTQGHTLKNMGSSSQHSTHSSISTKPVSLPFFT